MVWSVRSQGKVFRHQDPTWECVHFWRRTFTPTASSCQPDLVFKALCRGMPRDWHQGQEQLRLMPIFHLITHPFIVFLQILHASMPCEGVLPSPAPSSPFSFTPLPTVFYPYTSRWSPTPLLGLWSWSITISAHFCSATGDIYCVSCCNRTLIRLL